MHKTWKFFAIPLLMACATTYAQIQSAPVRGHYEREFVPPPTRSMAAEQNGRLAPADRFVKTGPKAIIGGALTAFSAQDQAVDAHGGGASWPQWGHDSSHSGSINVVGQSPNRVLADIIYDPFVEQEKASGEIVFGEADLFVHYQTPLVDGNDVFMEFKSGTYTDLTTWET